MPLSTLLRHLGVGPDSRPTAARIDPRGEAPAPPLIAPAVDPGIAVVPVEALLASHQDLLARIKLCHGADRASFEQDLLVPIRRLADYVDVLPATADNYFCEPGGLFRLALEIGFYALQGTDGHIVSGRTTISVRRHLEPRWRLATFFAGLCSELHRTLSQLVVTDEGGQEWPAYLEPLTAWLSQRQSARFFVRWIPRAPESRALGLFALPHVVSAEAMQHLASGNGVVVPQLLACIAGIPVYRDQNVLMELVKRAAALVIDRNLIANANRYGRPILGAHIERYLIDAMRRLVVSHPAWLPNKDKSRVWHGREGLFIVWPNAVSEIRKLLEEDELPGIPQSPQTILEILLGAGVVLRRAEDVPLWTISPPPGKAVVEAIKLAAPEILLPGDIDLQPLQESIVASVRTDQPASPPRHDTQAPAEPGRNPPADSEAATSPQGPNVTVSDDGEVIDIATTRLEQDLASDGRAQLEPSFRLAAPMRLQPQVRDALTDAIESMNGDPKQALAITVPAGVFVPLDHFKRANIDLPVVFRALAELQMAVTTRSGRPQSMRHDMAGQEVVGLVLRPEFVEGLDPSLFTPSRHEDPERC